MFYPTKPGSEEFLDVSLFIKKISYSILHQEESKELKRLGLMPRKFRIKLHNLDRFIKPDSDEFRVSGSDPPQSFRSAQEYEPHDNISVQSEVIKNSN